MSDLYKFSQIYSYMQSSVKSTDSCKVCIIGTERMTKYNGEHWTIRLIGGKFAELDIMCNTRYQLRFTASIDSHGQFHCVLKRKDTHTGVVEVRASTFTTFYNYLKIVC